MRIRTIALAAAVLLATTVSSEAAIITTGVWSPAPAPNNDGVPFYDNPSWDGPTLGIGFWNGAGWETLSRAPFTVTTTLPTVTLVGEVTNYANLNQIGWLGGGAAGILFEGWVTPIASGGALPGDRAFALWLLSPGGFWRTSDNPSTNFALFRRPTATGYQYRLGMEDLVQGEPDFNDAIIEWADTTQPVPEPATLTMLGAGLAVAARSLKKKRRV